MRGKKAGKKRRFRAGHTKEARVENPAETSAPDPERANEMLVLRCPPCLWQAKDNPVLGLQPSSCNGQIEDRPRNAPATRRFTRDHPLTGNTKSIDRNAVYPAPSDAGCKTSPANSS